MFSPIVIFALVALLVVAAAVRQMPLFLFVLALLLADILARVWRRYCLANVEFRLQLSRHIVEFGETVALELNVSNRKILPVAWLEFEAQIPKVLQPSRGRIDTSHRSDTALLTGMFTLRPYEEVDRRYLIPCTHRGEYTFGPIETTTGDLFGLFNQTMSVEDTDTLVVYPRVVPVAELGLPASQPLGDLRTESWIFEDPSRFAGVREYRPEDGMRRIHWSASARSQQLQVKTFESTTTQRLIIYLDADIRARKSADFNPDELELAITTAASIASWATEQGYHVGLVSNGVNRGRTLNVAISPSGDPRHLQRILETLARLQPYTARPFHATLSEGLRRLKFGETVVAISPHIIEVEAEELTSARRRGHPVSIVLTGEKAARPNVPGVTVRRVGPPDAWCSADVLEPRVG